MLTPFKARRWTIYVPAGSGCELFSNIKVNALFPYYQSKKLSAYILKQPLHDRNGYYGVLAGLTNRNNKVHVQSSFILPSAAPEYPIAKYIVHWDTSTNSCIVALRQTTPTGHMASKTYTQGHAHTTISKADAGETLSIASNPSEDVVDRTVEHANTDIPRVPLDASSQATEKEELVLIADDAANTVNTAQHVRTSDTTGSGLADASPASSPNTASSTSPTVSTGTSIVAQELDSELELSNSSKSTSQVGELLAPDTLDGVQPETDSGFLDTPVNPIALTPARGRGMQYNPDDSLFESPIKACNIVRPSAPTPGRARNRYMRDSASEEDESFVVPEGSDVKDVFGAVETSFACSDDSRKQLPPLDFTNITLPISVDALDLGFTNTTTTIRTHLDWLHLFLQPDHEGAINKYKYPSQSTIREWSEDAINVFDSVSMEPITVLEVSDPGSGVTIADNLRGMEIDLDAIFGGQGATDLGDDEPTGYSPSMAPVHVVSTTIPEGSSIDTDNEREESKTNITRPRVGYHLNYLANEILLPSNTPAIISLFVQMAATRKAYHNPCSREGVMLAQANRYIDAVAYYGHLDFEGLQALRGSSFQDQTIGYALKVNDPQGSFGDKSDGESVIMDFEEICDHYLVQDSHSNLQHPYKFSHENHQYSPSKMMSLRLHAPTTFYTKRDAAGLVQHWIKTARPGRYRPFSKLCMVQSADDATEKDDSGPSPAEVSSVKLAAEEAEVDSDDGSEYTQSIRKDACSKAEADGGEYSPFDPCIPGLVQAAHEDWQPKEMPEDEALRHVDHLLERVAEENNAEEVSIEISADSHHILKPTHEEVEGHSHEDEIQHLSGGLSSGKDSDEEKQRSRHATTPPSPITSASLSLFFSPISIVYDCSPCVLGATNEPVITEATTSESTEQSDEEGLSRYAAAYAAIVIGVGILLSFW
ncbi:MAG: hypothetical protein Q9211_002811 [Gyalolechia sp. 1 TL-2023]